MDVGHCKFTWEIKNFSKVQDKELHSDFFYVGSSKWKVVVYPKVNKADHHMSIHVEVANPRPLASGRWRSAKFSFSVINQFRNDLSYTKVITFNRLKGNSFGWGPVEFVSHEELYDLTKGYLVNDTCIIEAGVSIYNGNLPAGSLSPNEVDMRGFSAESYSLAEEDMDGFFGDLHSLISPRNDISLEEEAKKALVFIEEAVHMVPTDVNNPCRMTQLRNAFDVLSLLDDGAILMSGQKEELLSMKDNFICLPARAAQASKDFELLTQKETLDRNMEICLIEFEKAKAETTQSEQNIATLLARIKEMKNKKEKSLSRQKEMFELSKELKAEMDLLVKNWPENEVKIKAAEEENKVVGTEWSKLKQFVSSLKKTV